MNKRKLEDKDEEEHNGYSPSSSYHYVCISSLPFTQDVVLIVRPQRRL